MKIALGTFFAVLVAVAVPHPGASAAGTCEGLASRSIPNVTITSARTVPAGAFAPPESGAALQGFPELPTFCRVTTVLKPSADSHIETELWLPLEDWNGKFQAVGNGGWAGAIGYPAMARALADGYATAATDTGHTGNDAAFAIDHPEKLVDFAFRAVHEMTATSKTLVTDFYSRAPRLSYWNGCSTGGRQGLMEAQKYPEDFDAILAGAPANYQTHLHAWDLGVAVPALKDPASAVPAAKLAVLNKAVLQACDAADGVKDGLLNEPQSCRFDPSTLLCRGSDTGDCLTAPQVESVKRMYARAHTKSGAVIFPGKAPGSETGWTAIAGGTQPAGVSLGSFRVAYNDANWDWRTFDLDRDLKIVDERVGAIVNAVNPDLAAFKARGGKLLLYHGWNDTAISPGNTVEYYQSVLGKMGSRQDEWIRLFMAPGMQHCGNGPGPNQADFISVLERWRELGAAPDHIVASHVTGNRVDMTRPLCPYPQVAVYGGTGSTRDAPNFSCQLK
jgi:feruloyl esterase